MSPIILLIIFIIHLVHCSPNVKLEISPNNRQVNVAEGEHFRLTCYGVGQEPAFFTDLKWFDPKGQEIRRDNEFYNRNYEIRVNKPGNLQLSINSPSENLSGNYTCRGLFQNVHEMSESVHVSVFQDISFQDCPSTQALIRGNKNSLIRCKVSAKPPAELNWSKNGADLQSGRFLRSNDGLIVNGEVDDSLTGKYDIEAHVTETGKIKYSSIVVNVYTLPEIVELKPVNEVIEDEQAQLECKAIGLPPPRYYWLDSQKRNLSSVGGYLVDTNNGQLIINRVDKEFVNGEFTCLVENAAGIASRVTQINVLSRPKIIEFHNRTSVQGNNAELTCLASGNPVPRIELRKDGEKNPITSGGGYEILESKNQFEARVTMKITKVQRQDDGLYYCTAENKINNQIGRQEQIGHLQVEFKPDLSKTPNKVKTWMQRPVNLTCIVSSIPNATVSWYFRDKRLQDNDYYQIYNEDQLSNFKHGYTGHNHLNVYPRAQTNIIYGDYTCRAENKHGYDYAIINLSQAHSPTILQDPDLTNDSPNSILIKFSNDAYRDGGLPVKKMRVQYRERNATDLSPIMEEFPFDNDYILKGLIPRRTYYLRFALENDVGVSDWTREFEKIMPKESVPDCPRFTYDRQSSAISTINLNNLNCNINLRPVEAEQSDRFDIKWLQPNDNGRPIEYYTIKVYPVVRVFSDWNRIGDYKELKASPNNQLVNHLSGLRPNTTYEVEIRAKNSEGYSPSSRLVFRTAFSDHTVSSFQEKITKAFTDFHLMIIIVLVSIVVVLFVLDIILYVRYDFGVLFCICHGCSSSERHRAVKKIKNSHSLNTAYAYHRPSAEIDPIMDINHKAEFKAELENRLIRLPKHSAV